MESIYTAVYEKLTTLQWIMRTRAFHCGGAAPFVNTARGQGRILAMLKIQPEIATKDLAYLLGIRQQSLNKLYECHGTWLQFGRIEPGKSKTQPKVRIFQWYCPKCVP